MRRTGTGCAVASLQGTSRASAPGGERLRPRCAGNVFPTNITLALLGMVTTPRSSPRASKAVTAAACAPSNRPSAPPCSGAAPLRNGHKGGLLVPFGSRDLLAMTSHNIGDAQRRLICGDPSGGPSPQGGALHCVPPLYITERCAK